MQLQNKNTILRLLTGLPLFITAGVLQVAVWFQVQHIQSWKLYAWKREYTALEKLGISFFLGVLGFLICGFTWASSLCTAPIFWLFLGCGAGINSKLKNKHALKPIGNNHQLKIYRFLI